MTIAAMRSRCADAWACRSTSAISRANTGTACSRTSSPNTPRAARRTPTCCATARSSSSISSTPRMRWAPSASPPGTTRAWRSRAAARSCCAPWIATRTRVTSCTSSGRRSCRRRCSRWANWRRTPCAASRARPTCRRTRRRTPPASASSANGTFANSSRATSPPRRAKSGIPPVPWSANIPACSSSPSDSAKACTSAACAGARRRRGTWWARTSPRMYWSSTRAATVVSCNPIACGPSPRTGSPAPRPPRASPAPRRRAIASAKSPAR